MTQTSEVIRAHTWLNDENRCHCGEQPATPFSNTHPIEWHSRHLAHWIRDAEPASTHAEVLAEVAAERDRQIHKGRDAGHDTAHGLVHLRGLILARLRKLTSTTGGIGWTKTTSPTEQRRLLIECAALTVAAIEMIDGPQCD